MLTKKLKNLGKYIFDAINNFMFEFLYFVRLPSKDHGYQKIYEIIKRKGFPPKKIIPELLRDKKLNIFDIGASGGIDPLFKGIDDHLRTFLFEPHPQSAADLRKKGYVVVEKLVDEKQQDARKFYMVRDKNCSSFLKPSSAGVTLYDGPGGNKFDVIQELDLPTVDIASVCDEHQVVPDYIKIDTQGSELAVIKGMKNKLPLFLKTEVSGIHLYQDQCTLFDVGQYLFDKGFFVIELRMLPRRPRHKNLLKELFYKYPAMGMPMHGDAYFCPDWTREAGKKLIQERDLQWAALMLLHGQMEFLEFALNTFECPNKTTIHKILSQLKGK